MIGHIYIDNKDAYTSYGIVSIKGNLGNLVTYPPLKELVKNDWPEEDGQEVDLSVPALNTLNVNLSFAIKGNMLIFDFVDMLSDMAYHDFNFPQLGRTFRLRLSSQSSYEIYEGLETAKFTFANDFPRPDDYIYLEPVNSIPMPKGYEIDDRDLTDYGVMLLKGSNAEILKSPAVKKNLLQDFKNQDGAIYDGEYVKFQTKDVNLKCLMRAPDIETFWRNRDALLHDLTKLSAKTDDEGYEYSDAERIFYCDEWSESYPCYYKSCKTDSFIPNNGVWWEFTLTLVFTCFRLEGTEYLLSAEDGRFIITEDGENYIDLKDYAN